MNESDEKKSLGFRKYWPMVAITAGVVGVRYAWRRLLRRGLPAGYEKISLPTLKQPIEILRDKWGVPHIYAGEEADLFFAQGFIHAQDRLFQMDLNRRVGSGRLSEIVGPAGLLSDRIARYYGWTKAIAAMVDGADDMVREAMKAYSAGVNTYIDDRPLPPEFALLRYRPEPWDLSSTAAIGAVLAWGLSVNWETELLRMTLFEALGPEKACDLTPLAGDEYVTVMPDEDVDAQLGRDLMEAYRTAMDSVLFKTAASSKGVGSNNWVISGEHTASGRPILANDPHLPPTYPALWYENHLVGGKYDVTGFTMPGVPGVVIGHNKDVSWGFTNAFPDIQDVYVERFHETDPTLYEVNGKYEKVEVRQEVIPVRGRKPVVEDVRHTRHGPVFSDILPDEDRALTLRWASHFAHNHLASVLKMNLATDWETFRESLREWGFPSQNIVYADTGGNIGYVMPGMVPLRRQGKGLVPVPGWNDDHEWQGWLPFDDLPTLHNPREGRIVTANNRIHGVSYPTLLTGEWLPDYRARRITQLLENDSQQVLETHAAIQADTVSLQAREFLSLALPRVRDRAPEGGIESYALQLLAQWDGDMRADLVAPSLYSGWLIHYSQMVIKQAVGVELATKLLKSSPPETFQLDPFLENALDLSLQWLERGAPDWVGALEPLLLPALRKTIRLLQREFGDDPQNWLWGNLHQIRHEHPLTRVPGLGRSWNTESIPVGGDGQTVNQADITPHFPPNPVQIIASCRLLLDVGEWDNSLAVLPGGQSGNPASPHYEDGLQDWRNGRYHPHLYSRARIEEATERILILTPKNG